VHNDIAQKKLASVSCPFVPTRIGVLFWTKPKSVYLEMRKNFDVSCAGECTILEKGEPDRTPPFPGSNGLDFKDFMVQRSDFKLKMSLRWDEAVQNTIWRENNGKRAVEPM
jgi:hypothetical protein